MTGRVADYFGSTEDDLDRAGLVDDRLNPAALLYVLYVLDEDISRISLTEDRPFANVDGLTVGVVNGLPFINGSAVPLGLASVDGRDLLVVDARRTRTTHVAFDPGAHVVVGPISDAREQRPATVLVHGDEITVQPDGPVYVNGRVVAGPLVVERAEAGDSVLTMDLLLEKRATQWRVTSFSAEQLYDDSHVLEQERQDEFPRDFPEYRRSPRVTLEPPGGTVRLQKIEPPQKADKNSILKALLPPLGMVAVGVATSVFSGRNPLLMLGMALLSAMTTAFTVSQFIAEKRERRRADTERREEYERYLVNRTAELGRLSDEERSVRDFALPSPDALVRMVDAYDSRIYERLATNRDFLEIAVGRGDSPSSFEVSTDVDARQDDEDARRVTELVSRYSTQRNVPLPLSMRTQTVGLVGDAATVSAVVRSILLQIAFFHSYRDVNMVALVPERTYAAEWRPWRFLPHFSLQGLNLRGLVHDAKTRDMVLTSFTQILTKRRQSVAQAGREKPVFAPHYVLLIAEGSHLAGHGINEFLAEDLSGLGVTVIWCSEDRKLLPETVTAMVEYRNRTAGTLVNDDGVYVARDFVPYLVPDGVERAVRKLANLHHVEVEKNAVPSAVTFLEMYGVKTVDQLAVAERWVRADTSKTLAVPLGLRGKDDLVELNLHERAHGPHGLVAGTTGSGKSEIVQSYMLSLAVNFGPEDVGFLPIDFKGGGMANMFKGLPHLLGSITNLDGAASARALASIRAELQKRQRLFGEFDVNHINGYTRLYKLGKNPRDRVPGQRYPSKPLPHLFLISDEFAELKANQPDFMEELVSTARIGRSLGVHLILATQKPSGVVNDQIWSNSRFKLALKVADVADSNEIIKTPDAASIVEPGRAYLQVGNNEIYELFQSAWSGAAYEPDKTVKETVDERIYRINGFGQYELWTSDLSGEEAAQEAKKDTVSELSAIVDHIAGIASRAGGVLPDKPWLPPLGTRIPSPPVGVGKGVPLGLVDIPSRQAQEVYRFALEETSHTAVFGSPGFGASTLLQTLVMNLARKHTPEQVHVLLLDLGNNGLLPLKDLPHVADIVTLEEDEKFRKALDRIAAVLAERKGSLRAAGVATLAQYTAKTGATLPLLVAVLDGYDALANDKRKDAIDAQLIQVLREGAALGVFLVMSANRANSIRMNMSSNIPTKMALYMNDEGEVAALFGRDRVLQSEILGRGQLQLDAPTAIQFFLPCDGGDDAAVLKNLENEVAALDAGWTGARPERIPMVPADLTVDAFREAASVADVEAAVSEVVLFLGLNKYTATPESFELFRGGSLGIFPESGKQAASMFPFFLSSVRDAVADEDLVVIDANGAFEPLVRSSSCLYAGKAVLKTHGEVVRAALTDLIESGARTRRCVIINGLTDVVEKLMLTNERVAELLSSGSGTVQVIVLDQVSKLNSSFALVAPVKENLAQILFGGDLNAQRFVENLPFTVKKETYGKTVLHSLMDDELDQIVIPGMTKSEG